MFNRHRPLDNSTLERRGSRETTIGDEDDSLLGPWTCRNRSTGCGKLRTDDDCGALGPEVQRSTTTELSLAIVTASTKSSVFSDLSGRSDSGLLCNADQQRHRSLLCPGCRPGSHNTLNLLVRQGQAHCCILVWANRNLRGRPHCAQPSPIWRTIRPLELP